MRTIAAAFVLCVFTSSVLAQSGEACLSSLNSDPSLSVIANKVALDGKTDRQYSLMAIPGHPNEAERQAIRTWLEKREHCWNRYQPPDGHPGKPAFEQSFRESQMLILRLMRGELAYGQFNEQRSEKGNNSQREIQQSRARYEEQQQRELLARQQENERQRQMQIQLMVQQQQQNQQQQQYQQQREDYLDQACLNRARNQIESAQCGIARGARQIGGALLR
jgi:hypothetical protein